MKGSGARLRWLCSAAIAAVGLALLPVSASESGGGTPMTCITEATGTQNCTGATAEANSTLTAKYQIELPAHWNGTLVLYSHGYDSFTVPLAPHDAGDPVTGAYLLSQGYALAGSAYARAGW